MGYKEIIQTKLMKYLSDELYLKIAYYAKLKKSLNIKNPKNFNEKLQWLKLYDKNPLYPILVDKKAVKDYISQIIGSEYIIPTLGAWDKFDDIDFDKLPNQFVLKCNHYGGGSGIVIVKNKEDIDYIAAKNELECCLKKSAFDYGREWPYKEVKPCIIAEQYMEDKETKELRDYKFFVFNGTAKAMFIATDRNNPNTETHFDYFDMDFNHMPYYNVHENAPVPPKKPEKFILVK